jgi:hypothetical protein
MESAQVRSTGDTTFLLEQHTPEPTPLEEKEAPMTESNPIEAANAQIAAPTTESANQHSTAASQQAANMSATESVDQSTSQAAHTSNADSATSDSTPIKTTTNVYHTDSANQKLSSLPSLPSLLALLSTVNSRLPLATRRSTTRAATRPTLQVAPGPTLEAATDLAPRPLTSLHL